MSLSGITQLCATILCAIWPGYCGGISCRKRYIFREKYSGQMLILVGSLGVSIKSHVRYHLRKCRRRRKS